MGMLLRRYHEDTEKEVKPTTYEDINKEVGVAEEVAPIVVEESEVVEEKPKTNAKKSTAKKK